MISSCPFAEIFVSAAALGAPFAEPAQQPDLFAARQIQAMSFAVHIPIVCFGIALPAMVLFVEGLWLRTGDPLYKTLAKRWSKVMLVLFAVGVVTGTILSFEFGLLWPQFTAAFGGVFGLGFALEGYSFFVEAIFIAIYVYGWERFSPRVHFLLGLPVAIAGVSGSLMVIAVNAWMNHPQGFEIIDGNVTNIDPWGALFGGNLWYELVHMYLAGYLVVGFCVAGVYAWRWLKGRRTRYCRVGLVVALSFAALAAPVQVIVGDWAARTVAERQPTKLAAFEGLYKTTDGAPFHLGGVYKNGEIRYGLRVPKLLSLLAKHDPNARVEGLEAVPARDRPPVNVVHLSFQIMVAIGTALVLLGGWFLLAWVRRRRLPNSRWFYRALVAAGPLAIVALIAGWTTTEVGRQPWVVYHIMRTTQAVTHAKGVDVAYICLIVVYLLLITGVILLLRRLAARSPEVS